MQASEWKWAIQEKAKTLFEGKRGPQTFSAHSAPDRLYVEIRCLKMKLDWIKKVIVQHAVLRLSLINDVGRLLRKSANSRLPAWLELLYTRSENLN